MKLSFRRRPRDGVRLGLWGRPGGAAAGGPPLQEVHSSPSCSRRSGSGSSSSSGSGSLGGRGAAAAAARPGSVPSAPCAAGAASSRPAASVDTATDTAAATPGLYGTKEGTVDTHWAKRKLNGRLLYFAFTAPKFTNSVLFASIERHSNVFCVLFVFVTVCGLFDFRFFFVWLTFKLRWRPVNTASESESELNTCLFLFHLYPCVYVCLLLLWWPGNEPSLGWSSEWIKWIWAQIDLCCQCHTESINVYSINVFIHLLYFYSDKALKS